MFDPQQYVSDQNQLPEESFDWGTLQWLCHGRLFPRAEQTLGICHIRPGCKNPRHYHPNCEEVLYMLSGTGRHSFEDASIELRAGMTIRIPVGVTHNLENIGTDEIVLIATYAPHGPEAFLRTLPDVTITPPRRT